MKMLLCTVAPPQRNGSLKIIPAFIYFYFFQRKRVFFPTFSSFKLIPPPDMQANDGEGLTSELLVSNFGPVRARLEREHEKSC